MPHLSRRVQAGHPIVGSQVDVSTVVFDQALGDVQVALLAGQVQGGGPDTRLVVHTPVLNIQRQPEPSYQKLKRSF